VFAEEGVRLTPKYKLILSFYFLCVFRYNHQTGQLKHVGLNKCLHAEPTQPAASETAPYEQTGGTVLEDGMIIRLRGGKGTSDTTKRIGAVRAYVCVCVCVCVCLCVLVCVYVPASLLTPVPTLRLFTMLYSLLTDNKYCCDTGNQISCGVSSVSTLSVQCQFTVQRSGGGYSNWYRFSASSHPKAKYGNGLFMLRSQSPGHMNKYCGPMSNNNVSRVSFLLLECTRES
jgi:hypothetical protein